MGSKVSPIVFRLNKNLEHRTIWFSRKKNSYREWLLEDINIRDFIEKKHANGCIGNIIIERKSDGIYLNILCLKPALIVGRKEENLDLLKKSLEAKFKKTFFVKVKANFTSAGVVVNDMIKFFEKNIQFKTVVNYVFKFFKKNRIKNAKICISGRLNGADIARKFKKYIGSIPATTINYDIDYACGSARTVYGALGIKCWINNTVPKFKETVKC